jgi:hypothetical protein
MRYTRRRVKRTIVDFHQDAEGHWVADLSCGHGQHFRHTPPWMNRPWVLTPEGRQDRIGTEIDCRRCDNDPAPPTSVT